MQLRYLNSEGQQAAFELGVKPVIIGRGEAADIRLQDEKVSRRHCEIRLWDGDFVLKDLKSHNGTYVNERPIEVAILHSGDSVRVGNAALAFEKRAAKGTTTVLSEVGKEMDGGKGYRTLLREIVRATDDPRRKRKGDKPPAG
jgi:pSer/pThr/pTyr-binding forkhead associated (FHA) protein